jgi:rubrerythrin
MMRLALARLTSGLRWSTPERAARLYLSFARAERSSHYDMLAAARLSRDLERRALYLHHAADEERNARMFSARAEQLAPLLAHDPRAQHADFEHLFEELGEARFLAFVHVGEARGRAQLSLYRDELSRRGDERGRALFEAVLADEQHHQDYTLAHLASLVGAGRVRRELRGARLWEARRGLSRAGRAFARLSFALCMRLLYLLLLPLVLIERLSHRRGRR